MVYASTRDWSGLYGAIRSEPETAAQPSCSHFWTSLGTLCCLSSACIAVGAVTVTPAENCVSPLSPSPLLRVSIKKKKKSVSPHDSLAVHPDPSERSPTLPSSSGLCVRQNENEQQSTVDEVSQPLKVMALARRLAGPDNAAPSLPGSDSWLSKKETEKIRSLFLHVLVQSSYILDVVGTFWMLGSSRAFDFVWLWLCHLCDLLTIRVRDKPATWLVTVNVTVM